jgi:hypothetical protein
MKYLRERSLMVLALIGLPALILGLGIFPVQKRAEALRARLRVTEEEYKATPRFAPLSTAERSLLQDSQAPWRTRMPLVAGDRARLAHYSRVVGELQGTLLGNGTPAVGMRSSWDPIQASFTLQGSLPEITPELGSSQDSTSLKASGWVLEAEIPGTTENLFQALGAIHKVRPLMEPVGLRWEATLEQRRQHLLLRNLVLIP